MSFKEKFNGLLLEFIRQQGKTDAIEVTGYEETSSQYWSGGCDTCGNYETEFEVEIRYKTGDDTPYWSNTFTYNGGFVELIDELTAIDEKLNS